MDIKLGIILLVCFFILFCAYLFCASHFIDSMSMRKIKIDVIISIYSLFNCEV